MSKFISSAFYLPRTLALSLDISYVQASVAQKEWLHERTVAVPQLSKGILAIIGKDPNTVASAQASRRNIATKWSPVDVGEYTLPGETIDSRVAEMRTSLDRFTESEAQILVRHGYSYADILIRKFDPENVSASPQPTSHVKLFGDIFENKQKYIAWCDSVLNISDVTFPLFPRTEPGQLTLPRFLIQFRIWLMFGETRG